jgi:hypothetical protein
MRGVGQHRAALVQGLAHQADLALTEVAHAAVQQLGGARGGALGEVLGLQQRHAQAALRGVERQPEARGAAADDDQVVALDAAQALQQFASLHQVSTDCWAMPASTSTCWPVMPSLSSAARNSVGRATWPGSRRIFRHCASRKAWSAAGSRCRVV